ncbi:hypothetical protein BH18ACI5_BH18ACI5_22500 [soil metagenome]
MNTIGRYQLLEKLGQGGMGVVHRAVDPLLQRTVAVKLISSAIDADEELRERFFREARAAGQLSHKNIITIYDLGEHEGQPFLAMEFLEGQDLQQRLAAGPPMTLARKLELAIEICEGIEYAHVHGVVHRDIKPANIFITTAGTVKILDFGLARLITSDLTHTNMMMGTLNYMAPEQVRGERADHRSDIFSTGVVLYEVFAGRKAFEGDSFGATLYKILEEFPEPLPNLDASLPLPLVGVVDHAMRKAREERYQHMSEMLADLVEYRQQLGLFNSPSAGRPASGMVPPSRGSDAPTMAHVPPMAPTPPASGASASVPLAAPLPLAAPVVADGPGRRKPLVIAGIAGAVLLGGVALWMSRPEPPAPTPAPTVQSRPEPGPVAPAQPAAQPANTQQTANRVAKGIENARGLLASGQHEAASRAASEVMALEPANLEARRVMDESAAASRGKGADEAQQRMQRAKAGATAANASIYAPRAYAAAVAAEREAASLFQRGRAAEAMAKFWEATGLFTGSEGAARSEAAARTERARIAAAEQKAAETAPRQDPAAPKPSTLAPAPPQPVTPIPSATGLPLPPVPQPEAPAAARPAPPPAESPLPPASPTAGIAELLDRYKAALESRNLDALKRLWPGLRGAQESAIRTEFQNASSINVEIVNPQTALRGTSATVTFVRRYQLETIDRQRLRTETRTTMHLQKNGSTWTIDQMTFEPVK